MLNIKYLKGNIQRWITRSLSFNLLPLREIISFQDRWEATGNESAFSLVPINKNNLMPRGWYMLSICIEANTPYIQCKLYPDYGLGYAEDTAFEILLQSSKLTKRLCYFPKISKKLRLDPCDFPCQFKVQHLQLTRVPPQFAVDRMSKKLRNCKSTTQESKISKIHAPHSIQELWERYNSIFIDNNRLQAIKTYQEWINTNECRNNQDSLDLTFNPLISIIVPVWNTPEPLLVQCIESVLKQSYTNWQLCLADDASESQHISNLLKHYSSLDSRICYITREINGHICKASNSSLALAEGKFIGLLDHDDELASNALLEVVKALNITPNLDIIYSDEDFIDLHGNRSNPHFKSDWNPELLKAHNYITHLCVYRHSLLKAAGGFRENAGVEGAQDYDLLLRCSSLTTPDKIHHIPKILYHWRAHEGSTALAANEKSYCTEAGRKALQKHITDKENGGRVALTRPSNFYKVEYPLHSKPLVSILIPTRDGLDILQSCINSILSKTSYSNYEILILDNQSERPETQTWFEEISTHSKVRILSYDKPFNYSAINNFGFSNANGDIIGLLNNDVEIINADWLYEMASLAIRPENGCIGAKLYYPDDTIQHAGVILGLGGYAAHSHRGFDRNSPGYFNRLQVRQNLSAVTGACMLVRREVWEHVGGLDEQLAIGYNDVDFCLRVREAGYLNVFTPYAELYHHESKTRGKEDTPDKKARFDKEKAFLKKRWGKQLQRDPYYNPNLTTDREDFTLS
jgi:GT2 family glycosyltransferase